MNDEKRRTRVALDMLGCKLNQAEIELLARELNEAGYNLVAPTDKADIYVLNTCTVTHIADRKCRHRLRLAKRQNPDALLVATGCYAERAREELEKLGGIGLILGNEQKSRLRHVLEEYRHPGGSGSVREDCPMHQTRTRAFIKIQDGCNNYCSYCIVPIVRGREISLPVGQVIDEINSRTDENYKEVVLTGVKIGSYNYGDTDLGELLRGILLETGAMRIRLSSLQPQEISDGLVQMWGNERLCRHFHLSLQSGSDEVLKLMNRRYSASDYQEAVSLIRTLVPEAAITTDIIVGFPGESSADFEQSYQLCRKLEFARIHIFPYSSRPETRSARMPHQVGDIEKRERRHKMLALAEESARKFNQRFLGTTMPVLWEKKSASIWSGHTDNYIKVYTRSDEDLANKLHPAKLVGIKGDGVWGEGINIFKAKGGMVNY